MHEKSRSPGITTSLSVAGGPAGFAAALAAARSGASTMLIEVHGCIGGIWTAGMLSWILDGVNKPGIMRELASRIESDSVGRRFKHAWVYHPEPMKLLLEDMLLEAGVDIRLFTRVVGAVPDDSNRLSTVVTESKTGREVWTAKTFIDATGDGDLARTGRLRIRLRTTWRRNHSALLPHGSFSRCQNGRDRSLCESRRRDAKFRKRKEQLPRRAKIRGD